MAYEGTYVAGVPEVERLTLFSSDIKSKITLILTVMVIGYIFLWFYNTEAAIRITIVVVRGIGNALIAIAKGVYAVVRAIGRWISR